jgi:soluble lytic murein transglycosylase-like protein
MEFSAFSDVEKAPVSRCIGVRFFWLGLCPLILLAEARDPSVAIRAAMQSSLEKQQQSVRLQAAAARKAPPEPEPVEAAAGVESAVVSCDKMAEIDLQPLVETAAKREGLEARLVRAVVDRESRGVPCAVSPKGAQGLMQLMPATAEQFGVADPFNAKQNIDAGAKMLKQLLTKYNGNIGLALGAYNAGSGRVDRAGTIPEIPETQAYVSAILDKLKD